MKQLLARFTLHCEKVLADIQSARDLADQLERGDVPTEGDGAIVADVVTSSGFTPHALRTEAQNAMLDHIGKIVWMTWPMLDVGRFTVGSYEATRAAWDYRFPGVVYRQPSIPSGLPVETVVLN